MLYIESPAGVGFSETKTLHASDDSTAADNFAALKDFFTLKFPELLGNEFFISGESYGGVYIPYLATKILENAGEIRINLKGFLIGNGCTIGEECTDEGSLAFGYSWFQMKQFNDHAFFGFEDWDKFTA